MDVKALLQAALLLQVGMSVVVLGTMWFRRASRIFPYLACFLLVQAVACSITVGLLYHRVALHLSRDAAYSALYYSIWVSGALLCLLRILIIYSVFTEAMRPMTGLHKAGKIIFRWVGVVSALVAFAMVAGPGVFSNMAALEDVFSRLQQGVSVLTICLLVFVCFAVRPLGLTFRSHLFGVSLGLGISASVELVQAAWLVTRGAQSLYSPVYLLSSLGFCLAIAVWGTYFAMPEPARKMILLPTTSPFFFWNRISEILGDSPGHVAVAGFSPDMLAPAEIEMLTAATSSEGRDEPEHTHFSLHEPAPTPDLITTIHPSLAL